MAKQDINLGTAPSGLDGDDARTAFQKTNANFTELYERIGGTGGVGVTIADANSPTASGFYLLSTAASGGVNGPPQIPSIAWSIIHISGSSNGNASGQIAFPLTSVAANKHRMFHRQQFGGTWSDWKEVLDVEAANAVIASVVAAFGLGVSQQPNWPNTSINDCSNVGAGVYRTLGGNTGMPAGWNTSNTIELQIRQSDSSQFQATQVLHNPGTNRTAFRHCTGASTTPANPTWGDWVIVSSEAYVTSTLASVLASYGLGVTSISVVPMATVDANRVSNFLAISSADATASGLPLAVNHVIEHIPGGSGVSGHKQRAYPLTSVTGNYRRCWIRAMWSSSWGPWEECANESMVDSKLTTALGSYGIGTIGPNITDLDVATDGGIYRFSNTAANTPLSGASGLLLVEGYSAGASGYTAQTVITVQTNNADLYNRMFTRTRNQGTWGPWKERMDTGMITRSALDSTAGKILKVGDFGLGALSGMQLTTAQLDSYTLPTGLYRIDIVGTHKGLPAGPYSVTHNSLNSGNAANQVLTHFTSGVTYIRSNQDNDFIPQMEYGSNANGEYFKYANGALICRLWARAFNFVNASNLNVTWTYPMPFVQVPTVSVNLVSSTLPTQKQITTVGAYSRNVSSAVLAALSVGAFVAADASGNFFDAVAVGRWS
ncbi:pyocin knob domain-containing protein [Pseudomonas sp. I2]|uniref:pyocin knob domain-containing protein n=1 Tax=Pseudomonas sp. I2 TaxID=1338438 RepID=UPI0034D5A864